MNLASIIPLADGWGMHGGWMVLMMVPMMLFWAAIIFGIFWLVRGGSDGWRAERKEKPIDILERRFAEGAISADEYHERRDVIARS